MTVQISQLVDDEYEVIGSVEDGEIVEGEDELRPLLAGTDLSDEAEIVRAVDGPYVVAEQIEGDPPQPVDDTDQSRAARLRDRLGL